MVSPFPLTRSAVPCSGSQMEEHSIMLIQVVSIRSLCCPLKPCEYEIAKHLPEILNCLTLWRRWHCCWSCQPAAIVGCVVVAGVAIAIGYSCRCLFVFWVFLVECWLSYLHDPLAPSMNNYERKQEYRNTLDEMYIMDSDSLLSSCIQWTFWYTDSGVDARLYISSFHTKTACADWVCSMRTRKHSCTQSLTCLCCMWTASKAPYGASPCGWQDLNMSFTHLKDASYETTCMNENLWGVMVAITDYFHLLLSFEAF